MASSKHQIRLSSGGVWNDIKDHATANGSHPGWTLEKLWDDYLARNPRIADAVKARAALRKVGTSGE